MHRLYGPLGDVHALMSDSSEMACAFVVFTILAERGFVSKFEFKSADTILAHPKNGGGAKGCESPPPPLRTPIGAIRT